MDVRNVLSSSGPPVVPRAFLIVAVLALPNGADHGRIRLPITKAMMADHSYRAVCRLAEFDGGSERAGHRRFARRGPPTQCPAPSRRSSLESAS